MEGVRLEHDADGPRWIIERPVALTADSRGAAIGVRQIERIFIVVDFPAPFGPRKPSVFVQAPR